MKKASFTKIQPRSWMTILGRPLFLVLLISFTISLQNGQAQYTDPDSNVPVAVNSGDCKHPLSFDKDGKYQTSTKYVQCNDDKKRYTDDDFNESGLYFDKVARMDTLQICGEDAWHKVLVTFNSFDLAVGDTLFVYDGDSAAIKNMPTIKVDTLTGFSVSSANGGWVGASCSPSQNPSGCLTFVFKTNGDNGKGTGWDAFVECTKSNFKLDATIANKTIQCDQSTAWAGIPVPTFAGECDFVNYETDTICLIVRSQNGKICPLRAATDPTNNDGVTLTAVSALPARVDTLCGTIADLRYRGLDGVFGTASNPGDDILASLDLGPGQYTFEIFLKADPSEEKKARGVFAVSLPSLVCNDEVEIPLNSSCGILINPDDLLENQCIANLISYEMEFRIGKHAGKDTLITHTVSTGSGSTIPSPTIGISRDVLRRFTNNQCGGNFDVKITRVRTPFVPQGTTGAQIVDINGDGIPDVQTNYCDNGDVETSCHTTVNYKDQTAPAIQLSSDIETIYACDAGGIESLFKSLIIDNCDENIQEELYIDYEESDACFSKNGTPGITKAIITLKATDACGNYSTLTETFNVERPTTIVPPKSIILPCTDYQNGSPAPTRGLPGLQLGYKKKDGTVVHTDTIELSETEYICGYILLHEKIEVPQTDCGQKEVYNWKFIDWCNAANGPTDIGAQFIEYQDTLIPHFVDDELPSKVVELGHFECTFNSLELDEPPVAYLCSRPVVYIDSIYAKEDGKLLPVEQKDWKDLTCGSYRVKWKVEDACHIPDEDRNNSSSSTPRTQIYEWLDIQDVTKPSVITTDQLIVSVPNEWGARVHISDIDAGSSDACGYITTEIRREDDENGWGEYVTVNCTDIGTDLRVYLRVTDTKGNQNTAWMVIKAENRITPTCADLPNKYATCSDMNGAGGEAVPSTDTDGDGYFEDSEWQPVTGDLLNTFESTFGKFDCSSEGTCGTVSPGNSEEEYQSISLQCGQYEIRRRFRIKTDGIHGGSNGGNSWAFQTINVGGAGQWKVTLPADVVGECTDDISAVVPPVIESSACDVIAWEVEDKIFGTDGDACSKIERTYHIINWCNYSAGGEPVSMKRFENNGGHVGDTRMVAANDTINRGLGYFTYIQILKIQDNDAPMVVVDNPEDICINGDNSNSIPFEVDSNSADAGSNNCRGEKTWTAWADDCTEEESIRWVGRLYTAGGILVHEVNSPTLTYPVNNKDTYYAEFWAYDGCGNSGGGTSDEITFKDCQPPVAYLLNGVALNLTSSGTVEFWASDVDKGSFDNCNGQDGLVFYLHDPHSDAPVPTTYEEVIELPQAIEYDCFKVGTQAITIYVVDEDGSYDFATSTVNIQDNNRVCQGILNEETGFIAGSIINADGEMIEAVDVSVNGGAASMKTSENGTYQFTLAKGNDYTVTPEKDIDPLNGVSTFDLVLMSKHILGIAPLDSPYKQIAADVNKSGTITAYDMVQLRQLILNITTEFANNESWRFVDAAYEFSDNPLGDNFNEFKSINNLDGNMMEADFIAIKIGDVNENASPNSLVKAEVRSTSEQMVLQLNDQFVEAGQSVKVEISSETLAAIQGYQFTMKHAGLDLVSIEDGLATTENFNTNIRNAFTTSWNKTNEVLHTNRLFTLNFQASTSGKLSDLLSISSEHTSEEAYNDKGEVMDIELTYTGSNIAGFELLQNKPNPFTEVTKVGFHLPAASDATLKVLNVQGKVLSIIDGTYTKGYNEIQVNAKEFRTTGVLYYQLETSDFVATKKMIIID